MDNLTDDVVGRLQALHLLGFASVRGEREGGERRIGKGAENRLSIADGLETRGSDDRSCTSDSGSA